ncbi:hypothetical protein D3C84_450090 [compost metagenome]
MGADLAVAVDHQRHLTRPLRVGQVAEAAHQVQVQGAVDMAPGPFAGGTDIDEDRAPLVQIARLQHIDRHRTLHLHGSFLGLEQGHQAEEKQWKQTHGRTSPERSPGISA